MYSGTKSAQDSRYGSDPYGEEEEHKGTIVAVSRPFHDRWMVEEWDIQQKLECASSRSHLIRKWTREKRCERLKAERQMEDFSVMWGNK